MLIRFLLLENLPTHVANLEEIIGEKQVKCMHALGQHQEDVMEGCFQKWVSFPLIVSPT
jgi:hypothetical protein